MGTKYRRQEFGYTIIEVMLFFGVTGALMLGILGSATVGIDAQRYSDAVNTFASVVQQEFTNATNVSNQGSSNVACSSISGSSAERGTSDCMIIGRLLTVDHTGDMTQSNIVGTEPSTLPPESAKAIEVIEAYNPSIDTVNRETGKMNWDTKIERTGGTSMVSLLVLRSPRSGNIHSYVVHSNSKVIETTTELRTAVSALDVSNPLNTRDQYMCIDRSGWVLTPARAIRIAPYTSGPSGVSTVEVTGSVCA